MMKHPASAHHGLDPGSHPLLPIAPHEIPACAGMSGDGGNLILRDTERG
ncbi:MAG: hypothetical protein AAGA72_02735 [Pseudomonadota bacterium]